MDTPDTTTKRENKSSPAGVGGNEGDHVYPVHPCGVTFNVPDSGLSVCVPPGAMSENTLLCINTQRPTGEGMSSVITIEAKVGCDYFSKPILLKLELDELLNTEQTVLLYNPRSDCEVAVWVSADEGQHNKTLCTTGPTWFIRNRHLYLYIQHCCQFKLVSLSCSEKVNAKVMAVSIFSRSFSSCHSEVAVILHCRNIDMEKFERDQAVHGKRRITKAVLVLDDHMELTVEVMLDSKTWSLTNPDKDGNRSLNKQTHSVNMWCIDGICDSSGEEFLIEARTRKRSVRTDTSMTQEMDSGYDITCTVKQNDQYATLIDKLHINTGSTPDQTASPLDNFKCEHVSGTKCHRCDHPQYLPAEFKHCLERFLNVNAEPAKVVRQTTYDRLSINAKGNYKPSASNIVCFLEMEKNFDHIKTCIDIILTEFSEHNCSHLLGKFEKLIVMRHHHEMCLKHIRVTELVDFFYSQLMITDNDLSELSVPTKSDMDKARKLLQEIIPRLSDEQFKRFKEYLEEHQPGLATLINYRGFLDDRQGGVVALSATRCVPILIRHDGSLYHNAADA